MHMLRCNRAVFKAPWSGSNWGVCNEHTVRETTTDKDRQRQRERERERQTERERERQRQRERERNKG